MARDGQSAAVMQGGLSLGAMFGQYGNQVGSPVQPSFPFKPGRRRRFLSIFRLALVVMGVLCVYI